MYRFLQIREFCLEKTSMLQHLGFLLLEDWDGPENDHCLRKGRGDSQTSGI